MLLLPNFEEHFSVKTVGDLIYKFLLSVESPIERESAVLMRCLMGGTVDFVFLIDGTGSMNPCMQALKDNINVFLDEVAGAQSPVRNWRGKVVTYRDHEVDGSRWYEDNPFVVNDGPAFKQQLSRIEAAGGGDEPESALDALHRLATMEQTARGEQEADPGKWRHRSDAARVVILFTDASYKPTMTYSAAVGGTATDVTNALVNNKVILIMYAPNDEGWEVIGNTDKCEWEPVDASPTFVDGLKTMVSDRTKFKQAMIALAKSVSVSVAEVL